MNLVALLPHEQEKHRVFRTLKEIYSAERICYVSVNKPRETLLPVLEEWLELRSLFLVDAVTRTVQGNPEPFPNGAYVSSPGALDEIFLKVDELLASGRFGALVFDSLCTLTSFKSEQEVTRFVHKLLARVAVAKCEGIFLCVRPVVQESFIEELYQLADRVVHFDR